MPSSTRYDILEYRVDSIEKTQDGIISTVGKIGSKQSELVTTLEVLKSKLAVYVSVVGVIISVIVSLSTNYINQKVKSFTETEKKSYYEKRINESAAIDKLKAEIERLKKEKGN